MEASIRTCKSDSRSFTPFLLLYAKCLCRVCQAATFSSCVEGIGTSACRSGPCGSKRPIPVLCVSGAPASPMTHFLAPSLHRFHNSKPDFMPHDKKKNQVSVLAGLSPKPIQARRCATSATQGIRQPTSFPPFRPGTTHFKGEKRKKREKAKGDRIPSGPENGQIPAAFSGICADPLVDS